MKHLVTSTLILLIGSTFLVGCSTLSKHVSTDHVNINAASNISNSATDSRGSGTDLTNSNVTVATSNQTLTNVPAPSANSTGIHTDSQKSSRTNKTSTSKSTPAASSKHSSTVSNTTHSSVHSNPTTGKQPNESSTSSTKTSTGSTTNGGNPPSASASPSDIASTWTNKFNSMYVNRNYSGPNSSSFDVLVTQMAQGKITPDAAKKTILGMQPWAATWTAANNGDGKTYQFVVHDVGAFTYQTSVLNDDVTSQQWRAHAQEVLDDSFYTKWDVNWNSSTKTYTVAFLDIGFYLNSTN